MKNESPILITGCARSGTSMVAGIINTCGAWGGKLISPSNYNQKGFFENVVIRNKICKPFLESIGVDTKGQDPLPDMERIKSISNIPHFITTWRIKVLDEIKKQSYSEGSWYYKGAKMCLMWPIWNLAFPDAKWIIVRRDKDDIISSCMKTGFMSAFHTREGWAKWVDFHLARFDEMKENCSYVYEIYPQQIINGNFESIKTLINILGLSWDKEKVVEFVAPALWSNFIKGENYGKS